MRARCKVSLGCGICLFFFFVVSCFLSGCLLFWITSLLVSAGGRVEERLPLSSFPHRTLHTGITTPTHSVLPRPEPDTWMVLYCHPYHPLILKRET